MSFVDDQQPRVDHGPHGSLQRRVRARPTIAASSSWLGLAADRRDRTQHQSGAVVEIGDLGGDQIGEHDRDGLARQVRGDELAR